MENGRRTRMARSARGHNGPNTVWRVAAILAAVLVVALGSAACQARPDHVASANPVAAYDSAPATSAPADTTSTTVPGPTTSASTTTVAPTTTAPPPPSTAPPTVAPAGDVVPVVDVVDGDTVKVDRAGVQTTVRIIGMDTPETKDPRKPVQCFGPQASQRAHQLLEGRTVRLEQDPSQDSRDRYGRFLAYVWMPDGQLFEQVMIDEGYAHEYTYDTPYRLQSQLRAAEADARGHGRGLWSPATCGGNTTQPAGGAAPVPAPAPAPAPSGGGVYYPNCTAARAAGAAPLHTGSPGYRSGLDRDRDGVACE